MEKCKYVRFQKRGISVVAQVSNDGEVWESPFHPAGDMYGPAEITYELQPSVTVNNHVCTGSTPDVDHLERKQGSHKCTCKNHDNPALKWVEADPRVRGTVTGRTQCSEPNFEEVPREKDGWKDQDEMFDLLEKQGFGIPAGRRQGKTFILSLKDLLTIDFEAVEQRVMGQAYFELCKGRKKCHKDQYLDKASDCPWFALNPSGWHDCSFEGHTDTTCEWGK